MIQRLALVLLLPLAGCATQEPTASAPDAGAQIRPMLVQPLPPAPAPGVERGFSAQDTRGWIWESGAWGIRAEVSHPGLRCATYEVGIQVGRGDPACTAVSWLGEVDYATRLTHCNGAQRIHAGEGKLALDTKAIATANCVRVLTRCSGGC
jgi:hypothetical protein